MYMFNCINKLSVYINLKNSVFVYSMYKLSECINNAMINLLFTSSPSFKKSVANSVPKKSYVDNNINKYINKYIHKYNNGNTKSVICLCHIQSRVIYSFWHYVSNYLFIFISVSTYLFVYNNIYVITNQ